MTQTVLPLQLTMHEMFKYNTISFSVCRTCITRVPDSCGGGWCPDPPAPHSLHYLLLQGGQVLLLQVQFWQRWPPASRQGGHKPSPVQWSKRKWVQATASWPGEVKITTTVYFLTNWMCLVIMHLTYVYQPLLTTSWCALVSNLNAFSMTQIEYYYYI